MWMHDHIEAWNRHHEDAIMRFFAPDAEHEDLALGETFLGHEQIRRFAAGIDERIASDMRFELHTFVEKGAVLAAEWTMTGTHDWSVRFPATARSFAVPGVSIGRLGEAARSSATTTAGTLGSLLAQLGAQLPAKRE